MRGKESPVRARSGPGSRIGGPVSRSHVACAACNTILQQSTFVTKRGSGNINITSQVELVRVCRATILYAFKLAKVWKCHVSKYEIKQEQEKEEVLNDEGRRTSMFMARACCWYAVICWVKIKRKCTSIIVCCSTGKFFKEFPGLQ